MPGGIDPIFLPRGGALAQFFFPGGGEMANTPGRVASLALKEPNFSILASFDFVWLLKISFGFFLFFGSFWLLFE